VLRPRTACGPRRPRRGGRRVLLGEDARAAPARARAAPQPDGVRAHRSRSGGMKALLLAAGYATRLRPLTDAVAKPLLPVGGRPMIERILDAVRTVDEIDEVHVVTNSVYAAAFERWGLEVGVHVHDDGTASNDDRLGAIGDLVFALDRGGLWNDDLLTIAADNLFEFSLRDYVDFWLERDGSAIAVHRLADPSLASLYGVVELDDDGRVVAMEEKPAVPRSDVDRQSTRLSSS